VGVIRGDMLNVGQMLIDGLSAMPRIRLYSPRSMEQNVGIAAIVIDGMDSADVGMRLESRYGILTRVGLHCAPIAHRTIGTFPNGTIRLSIGHHTTPDDVGRTLDALKDICRG